MKIIGLCALYGSVGCVLQASTAFFCVTTTCSRLRTHSKCTIHCLDDSMAGTCTRSHHQYDEWLHKSKKEGWQEQLETL